MLFIVDCMVNIMVCMVFMVVIIGGSSVRNCGVSVFILFMLLVRVCNWLVSVLMLFRVLNSDCVVEYNGMLK